MQKLSAKKKVIIVRQYLSGFSYDEIAVKNGVSKGTVANVVTDLKAGKFPEAGDVGEQIEMLRELSIDLKRFSLNPGQCATGLTVLARIKECGLDPADIDLWLLILKSAGSEDDGREFVRLVYSIQEVQKRTGLSLDVLEDKVHELEKKAAELEPVSGKLAVSKKQVAVLTRQRRELSSQVASLEEKRKLLTPQVKDLEKRERDLSCRVAEMEPMAQKAEMTLSTLSKEIQRLQDIGFAFEELGEFSQRVQVVAQRHTIKPGVLRNRLLHELETLDKGLGLEALVKTKQTELDKAKQAVAAIKKELATTRAVVNGLKQEQKNLEAGIKETREQVSREIAKIIPMARGTVNQLQEELWSGCREAIAEVHRLKNEALQLGKEVGRCEEIIQANEWLRELLALVQGEQGIEAKRVRVIALSVARGVSGWLEAQDKHLAVFTSLSTATDNLIKALEQWKV